MTASPANVGSNPTNTRVNEVILSVALKLLLLTLATLDGCVTNFVLRVFDRRSKNGISEAKSPRADQSRKLYLVTNKNVLSRGLNANTGDLSSVGNASKSVSMLSSFLPVAIFGFLN